MVVVIIREVKFSGCVIGYSIDIVCCVGFFGFEYI